MSNDELLAAIAHIRAMYALQFRTVSDEEIIKSLKEYAL